MDIKVFLTSLITSIITSLGGVTGIALIVLFCTKNRLEKYIDCKIKLKFEKELEDYKLENEIKLMKISNQDKILEKKCLEGNEKISAVSEEIEKIQEIIDTCIKERKALYFYFGNIMDGNPLTGLDNCFGELKKFYNKNQYFFSEELRKNMMESFQIIEDYINGIKKGIDNINTNSNNSIIYEKGCLIKSKLEKSNIYIINGCLNIYGLQ